MGGILQAWSVPVGDAIEDALHAPAHGGFAAPTPAPTPPPAERAPVDWQFVAGAVLAAALALYVLRAALARLYRRPRRPP